MRKLLLRTDVPSLGYVGDVVEVKEGYARNYLIPQGLAMEPTPANLKSIEQAKKEAEARRAQQLAEKKALAEKLEGLEVTIVSRANEQGHLFGSVGPKEIADAIASEGYTIDERSIRLDEHLKMVDKYTVLVRLAESVEANVVVWVAPEKTEEEGEQTGESAESSPESHAEESDQ